MIEQESEGEKYFPTIAGVIHKGIKITETLELIDLAAEELQQLWIESPSGYLCKYSEIVSKDRDPHFLDFARVNKPDIIILDREHAKFVAEKLGVSVVLVSP